MEITLPNKPKVTKRGENQAVFEIDGCYPGYGMTLGNAFRRVLLSSLPGAAITKIKIKGVKHEFSTLPYVLEDIIQIILNLKQIRFKFYSDKPIKAFLKIKGEQEVKAGDIKSPAELEAANKEAHIAFLTNKKADLEMEMTVEQGLGYLPVEEQKKGRVEVGEITIDAFFSPIRKVTYDVERMRVKDKTDYNRLRLSVETDGTISPEEAFKKSAQILVDHFQLCTYGEKKEKKKALKEIKSVSKILKAKKENKAAENNLTKIKLEDLKFPKRVKNALAEAGIKTSGGLRKKTQTDLIKIEGIGEKGVKEIKKNLGRLGLTLKEK